MPYYNDDGEEMNPNLFTKPQLCLSCKNNDDLYEEIVCNLTRLGQIGEPKFICHGYEPIN